jgi:hypothetical protein
MMPRYHNINGDKVQFTAEEEAARDAEEKAWADGAATRELEAIQGNRRAAYREEADHLFFSWQAGESTEQDWLGARNAVKAAHPKPE